MPNPGKQLRGVRGILKEFDNNAFPFEHDTPQWKVSISQAERDILALIPSRDEIVDVLTSKYFKTNENITANGRELKCLLSSVATVYAQAIHELTVARMEGKG